MLPATSATSSGVSKVSETTGSPRAPGTPGALAELPLLPARSGLIPPLPQPVSNNAVAAVASGRDIYVVSLLGLGAGKTWRDTLPVAYQLRLGDPAWRRVPDVPGGAGRLAGVAVAVGGRILVIGGYTVAEDGSERSIETVHAYDPVTRTYRARRPMPVPVDDAVALVHADRYLYLVSGWHDLGNVNLVQVYDSQRDTWAQATPYPGAAVFGHAGGIVGDTMVIADGVEVEVDSAASAGKRRFVLSNEAYIGRIDASDHRRIHWHRLPPHPGLARYRMAATGTSKLGGAVLFAGGSDNPYNYNGVGYNQVPSQPSDLVLALSLTERTWRLVGRLPVPTMDHRGLLELPGPGDGVGAEAGRFAGRSAGYFAIIGGMRAGQAVAADSVVFGLR